MILTGKLEGYKEIQSSKILREYFKNININNKTYHKYTDDLPSDLKENIEIIKLGTIFTKFQNANKNCNILSIDGMNEIYISCIGSGGSDKVFETPHIDGIFFFLPFCYVYRCVFAIQGDKNIITSFPLKNVDYAIENDHFCGFDYNREIHNIYSEDFTLTNKNKRILVKFHYIIAPNYMPYLIICFYKFLNIKYNNFMRTLFLNSQKDKSLLSNIVNSGTIFYTNLHINSILLISFIYRILSIR